MRGRGSERDHKSQEPAGLVGRTGVAKCVISDRGGAESMLTCTAVPTQ